MFHIFHARKLHPEAQTVENLETYLRPCFFVVNNLMSGIRRYSHHIYLLKYLSCLASLSMIRPIFVLQLICLLIKSEYMTLSFHHIFTFQQKNIFVMIFSYSTTIAITFKIIILLANWEWWCNFYLKLHPCTITHTYVYIQFWCCCWTKKKIAN